MIDRRRLLQGVGFAALLQSPVLVEAAATDASGGVLGAAPGALDLRTAQGNVRAMAKMSATLAADGHKHGWYSGVLMGVVPGQAVRELVGIIGMSTQRLRAVPEQGGYQLLQKECGFFTDLSTGAVLDRWLNPYTNEFVEPFHIANPAVNRWILPVVKEERFYDRVQSEAPVERPFVLPWKRAGDRVMLEQRTHFWANNPLDPAVWKRESSGPRIQVSDCMSYNARYDDLVDPRLDSVEYSGHWVHVRPWQPWMLMGAHPGHCLYSAMTGSALRAENVPAQILGIVRERLPEFLQPPTEVRKSEPSMIRFMRERKPS